MTSTLTTDAYINSRRKNLTSTLTWGTASFKNHFGEVIDFNYKYFKQSDYIEDFSEGDVVNLSGRFTYEEESMYLPEGVLVIIDKAKCIPPPPRIHSWNILDLHSSAPYVNLQCQVIPDGQKPRTSIEGKTLFIEMSVLLYCNYPQGLREHYFTVSLKTDSPRLKSITPEKLRFTNFYAISGFLRQFTKHNRKIEFFIEACTFDSLSARATPIQPQRSGNITRTAPRDDVENYILKKYQSEQSPKRQRTNYDGTAENHQEITNPDENNFLQFPKPEFSAPITPTPPIEVTNTVYDATPDTSANLHPSPSNNKNKFQAINYNPNKKIVEGFHNLDPSSFISSTKKKSAATTTNTGSIQSIALNKLQEGDTQQPKSPTRSTSTIEDLTNEEK